MSTAIKDPDEVVDFRKNWTPDLLALGDGDTIASSTWLPADGITIGTSQRAPYHDDTTATVWLSGGTLGQTYAVVNRITTTGGRTLDWTLRVAIMAR